MRAVRSSLLLTLLLLAALAVSPALAAKKSAKAAPPPRSLLEGLELFQIGPAHSPIEFSIGWMGLSKVRGTFSDYAGTLALDRNDMTKSTVTIVIRTPSLTTFNERRDRDLKTADWFDVEKFPTAVFTSHEVVKQGDGYLLRGPLSLHGVSKDIEIPFTFNGRLKDMGGDDRAGFEGRVGLNRKDFGIIGPARYNALMELGKAMVGDDVDLSLAVEAVHQTPKDTLQDRAADSLWRAVVARGVAAVIKDYRALRASRPDTLPVTEFRMSAVGYQLADRGKPTEAIELFKLESETFPQSPSGLVGLAYAYATVGDRENSTASAQKAVAMNPLATRALEILRRTQTETATH